MSAPFPLPHRDGFVDFLDEVWNHPLPRLIRFVGRGVLPPFVVSSLDVTTNVLRINKEIYDQLSKDEQRRARRTHHTIELV